MNKITATVTFGNKSAHSGNLDEWQRRATPYTVTLRYQRRAMTVEFWCGSACSEPNAATVLDCLASDASGVESSRGFEDWCGDYGYDVDSRKAERTFKACEKVARNLRRLLGDDYRRIVETDEEKRAAFCA